MTDQTNRRGPGRRGGKSRRRSNEARANSVKSTTPRTHSLPAESQGNGVGIIRPDEGEPNLSSDLVEIGEDRSSISPERIAMVIVGLALVWIAILTYFVARMPDK
ncbi:MAG: hypothetical protein L0220_30690 [Acidobacteria bacterium]|nr:hypothetical protein [Acidobacteriota bacterium]